MNTMTTETENKRRNTKSRKPKQHGKGRGPKGPKKPWKQHFGPGMLVKHEKLGLGAVTSAFKWHICVHFFMTGHTETVNQKELVFTREAQIRRSKIRRAHEAGKPVASTSAPGTQVVHELNGFGVVEMPFSPDHASEPGKVLVSFDNDYLEGLVEVDPKELREVVPREKPEEDKKKSKRRR